jgi:RHS repeat-associated protein
VSRTCLVQGGLHIRGKPAYDKADRLIRRTYPNGIVQTNAFDTANRLTGLTYSTLNPQPSTLNLALAYAYDRNGNKVAATEKGTLDWPMPALTDETAAYTASGRLINRQVIPSPGGEGQGEGGTNSSTITYHHDSSGNMTNAVRVVAGTNAESCTLAYDEDNRTTSIAWSSGSTNRFITNRYDALGRRISRKLDGVETRYVLSLQGMERILCDTTASGQITASYVHGPDLCFKVDATNGLTCYHADAQANIIALTDAATNTIAQYAYTPYGRLLGSTNCELSTLNPQPYTFVGSQGVMEELPGLYFMRARYYSAEAGAFLSTDPVKHLGPKDGRTMYAYCNGNPTGYADPQGTSESDSDDMLRFALTTRSAFNWASAGIWSKDGLEFLKKGLVPTGRVGATIAVYYAAKGADDSRNGVWNLPHIYPGHQTEPFLNALDWTVGLPSKAYYTFGHVSADVSLAKNDLMAGSTVLDIEENSPSSNVPTPRNGLSEGGPRGNTTCTLSDAGRFAATVNQAQATPSVTSDQLGDLAGIWNKTAGMTSTDGGKTWTVPSSTGGGGGGGGSKGSKTGTDSAGSYVMKGGTRDYSAGSWAKIAASRKSTTSSSTKSNR